MMDQARKDNIFFKDHMDAFDHAIAKGHLTDNENDPNYAGNFMYMNSENVPSRFSETRYDGTPSIMQDKIIDYFKNIDTREYIKVYN